MESIETLVREQLESEHEAEELLSLILAASESGAELSRKVEGMKEEAVRGGE
jgi:septum formation topological specificity factor MinE